MPREARGRLAELTLEPGASVALVAREHTFDKIPSLAGCLHGTRLCSRWCAQYCDQRSANYARGVYQYILPLYLLKMKDDVLSKFDSQSEDQGSDEENDPCQNTSGYSGGAVSDNAESN